MVSVVAVLTTFIIYAASLFVGVNTADKSYFTKVKHPPFHKDAGFVKVVVFLHGLALGFVCLAAFHEPVVVHPVASITTAVFGGLGLGWLFQYGALYTFGIPRVLSETS